jgi:hypothetical protein
MGALGSPARAKELPKATGTPPAPSLAPAAPLAPALRPQRHTSPPQLPGAAVKMGPKGGSFFTAVALQLVPRHGVTNTLTGH